MNNGFDIVVSGSNVKWCIDEHHTFLPPSDERDPLMAYTMWKVGIYIPTFRSDPAFQEAWNVRRMYQKLCSKWVRRYTRCKQEDRENMHLIAL